MNVLLAPFRIVGQALGAFVGFVFGRPWWAALIAGCGVGALAVVGLLSTFHRPSPTVVQVGYRGTGMQVVYEPGQNAGYPGFQDVDAPLPEVAPAGKTAAEVYKNIQVLQNVDANQFLRLMAAMTQWVAPQAGCAFCHSLNNMADDSAYTKIIARRMLQMTNAINVNWKSHVGNTGVTCQTCHRGNAIPAGSWFVQPPPHGVRGLTEADSGQNLPAPDAGLTALPYDPLTPFLLQANSIRVTPTTALPSGGPRASINQTDWTYSLMIYFSDSLGVNCTYCHNTRALEEWDQSTPHRVTAWHGISMVRELNIDYMESLTQVFPKALHGPMDDVAKIGCVSCHNGAYKPFYGASTLSAYPALLQVSGVAPIQSASNKP
jgi:photosynthetic reaction center cytochrome c subunit